MNTTFVTTLFDIGEFEGNSERRSIDTYFDLFPWLAEHPSIEKMIIFIEAKNEEKIRRLINPEKHTIVIQEITDLPFHIEYEKIQRCGRWNKIGKYSSAYIFLINSKFDLISHVIEKGLCNTPRIGWIDFGIKHIFKDFDFEPDYTIDTIDVVNNQIHLLVLSLDYEPTYECHHSLVSAGLIHGGYEEIKQLCLLYNSRRDYLAGKGIYHFEEGILPWITENYPDLFHLYYGDYSSLLRNSRYIIQDVEFVLNLFHFIYDKNWKKCARIGKVIWESFLKEKFSISTWQLHHFLDNYYVCLFYLPDFDLAREIVVKYRQLKEENEDFRKCYFEHQQRIDGNFMLIDEKI